MYTENMKTGVQHCNLMQAKRSLLNLFTGTITLGGTQWEIRQGDMGLFYATKCESGHLKGKEFDKCVL